MEARIQRVSEVLGQAGARMVPSVEGLELRLAGEFYGAEVRVLRGRLVAEAAQGVVADAVLRLRARGAARPMVILVADGVSEKMVARLSEYLWRFASDVALGILDARGWGRLWSSDGLELLSIRPGDPESARLRSILGEAPLGKLPASSPFSDLGQWLIKVLMGRHVDGALLAVPQVEVRGSLRRGARFQGVRELAKAAGVSAGSVSRLLAALAEGGWIDASSSPPKLVGIASLLSAWAGAVRGPAHSFQASFLLPHGDPGEQLCEALRASGEAAADKPHARLALAGLLACSEHGLRVVRGGPAQIYMERPAPEQLERLGLRERGPSEGGPSDVEIWVPQAPESVFRGRVWRQDLPVSDVLQCWLDLRSHPARGREQADAILRHLKLEDDA